MTTDLLDARGYNYTLLTNTIGEGLPGLLSELVVRDYRLIQYIHKTQPDIMLAIGGTFIAHAGFLTKTPSLVFYDTENAKLQNLITYPFTHRLAVPDCYESWTPNNKTLRYPGYHELAYLAPDYFTPDRSVAIRNGLAEDGDTFFLRLVSWKANHDIGENGWDLSLLDKLLKKLTPIGKVIISSEAELPVKYSAHMYSGNKSEIHHLLAYCRATITESATMASESAVLGTPAVYIANTSRGYINELQDKYGLVFKIDSFEWDPIDIRVSDIISKDKSYFASNYSRLLNESVDVTNLICLEIDKLLNNEQI
jgi:predicted glycosyltransferase